MAPRLGLTFVPGNLFKHPKLAGTLEGLSIEIIAEDDGEGNGVTTATVRGADLAPVSIKPEDAWTTARKMISGEDLLVGDVRFDEAAHVKGPEAATLAILDAASRDVILAALDQDLAVDGGIVSCKLFERAETEERLRDLIERVMGIARCLRAPPATIAAKLAHNALHDPAPGARARNLAVLLRDFAASPAARDAARASLAASAPEACRIAASEHLDDGDTFRALLDAADAFVAVRAAEGVARRGDAGAEQRLIAFLAHGDDDVQLSAAAALGRVGSVRAVEALRSCPATSPVVYRVAMDAALRIQRRTTTGEERGRVTLADAGVQGALTLSPGESGSLSNPDPTEK